MRSFDDRPKSFPGFARPIASIGFLALAALLAGCPSNNNNPTAPNPPAPTNTLTAVPSATPSNTATNTPSPTITATPTATASLTPTGTATLTATSTSSATPTDTATLSPTGTPTDTATVTATSTPSDTPTETPTSTNTPLLTPTCTAFSSLGFTTNDGNTNFYQGFVFTVPVVVGGGDTVAYSLNFDAMDNGKTVQLGIYADSSNSPGALLGSTNATVVSPGWNQIWLNSPVYLANGTKYWLGYMFYDAGYSYAYTSNGTYQIGLASNSQYGSLPANLTGAMGVDYWYHVGVYAGTCP